MRLRDLNQGDVVIVEFKTGAVYQMMVTVPWSAYGIVHAVSSTGPMFPLIPARIVKITYIEMTKGEEIDLE